METAYIRACRRIAEQEARVARQEQIVKLLAEGGRSTEMATQLLHVMRATLNTLHLCLRHLPHE
jgi:hypothetical protein